MAAKGTVGLFINDDSLWPQNNDIVYETREVDVRVSSNISQAGVRLPFKWFVSVLKGK